MESCDSLSSGNLSSGNAVESESSKKTTAATRACPHLLNPPWRHPVTSPQAAGSERERLVASIAGRHGQFLHFFQFCQLARLGNGTKFLANCELKLAE